MIAAIALLALLSVASAQDRTPHLVNTVSTRTTSFSAVQIDGEKSIDLACEHVEKPTALDTPNPIMGQGDAVTLDFLVGTDGRVYSAFVLESTGYKTNFVVLKAMHSWRFRPASCNGSPVVAEGHVTFRQ